MRGLSVTSDRIVWTSGTGGTILRTEDGGEHWKSVPVSGAEALDFRDIEAFDADNAVMLSSGPGAKSNVFVTHDGGNHWQRTLENPDPDGFFDALAFLDKQHGFLVGDPVAGRFALFETLDGGGTWRQIMGPKAMEGESLFAGSGTCLISSPGTKDLWLGTGGGSVARVLHSADFGSTWMESQVPIQAGKKTAGVFSLAVNTAGALVAVGGDYARPDEAMGTAAISKDRGATWRALPGLSGYRSGIAFARNRTETVYAVGTNGSDAAANDRNWLRFSTLSLNVVASSPNRSIWAAGAHGLLVQLRTE